MVKKFFSSSKRKNPAQAMVEFALALPILLLIVYGLIETGRLIFIYASVVTAARQAARYGSASGSPNTAAPFTPYYLDCPGIRAAAKGVGFINRFNDTDIKITYDRGVDSSGNIKQIQSYDPNFGADTCTSAAAASQDPIQNGDRVKVQVSTAYSPIVPLVPFKPFVITSNAARTIVEDVPIAVTSVPQLFPGQSPLQLTKSASPTTYEHAGDIISFNYTLRNLGTSTIPGPFHITDSILGTFPCYSGDLAGGATVNCSAPYAVSQRDVDLSAVTNIAQAANTGSSVSNSATFTATSVPMPALSLSKSGALGGTANQGTPVYYKYVIINTGNVTLTTSALGITDDHVSKQNISCPATPATLAPGDQIQCSGTYSLSKNDVDNGSVTNKATATVVFNGITATSNQASAIVYTSPLVLNVTPSTTVVSTTGTLNYSFTFYNNGSGTNANLYSNYTVTGTINQTSISVTCNNPNPGSLDPGLSFTCNGSVSYAYSVTQYDLDLGTITATLTATAHDKQGNPVTSNISTTVVLVAQGPALSLTKTYNLNGGDPTLANTVITYTYVMTNSGNVTLSTPFAINDNKIASVNCPAPTGNILPPTGTITCTGTYTTTPADLAAGSIINQATASGQFGTQVVVSPIASATVITYNAPRLTLQKSANPNPIPGSGQLVTYTYTLMNTGNTPLDGPISVSDANDDQPLTVDCNLVSLPIPVGGSGDCTAKYTTVQADVTRQSITNNATATAYANGTKLTSSASLTVTVLVPIACDIRHSTLKVSPFGMTLFSTTNTAQTVSISEIDIYYNNNNGAEAITSLTLGGTTIWTGNVTASGSQFKTFTGDVTLAVGANKSLLINFSQPYVSNGTERVLVYFTQLGCPSPLDSGNNGQLP